MKLPTDEQIRIWAERIRESDRQAFDSLFTSCYSRLVYFACSYTQSMEPAYDVVQDVFVSVWQKRHEIQPQRSVKAWLYKMVRNRALNHLRDQVGFTYGLDPSGDGRPFDGGEAPAGEQEMMHVEGESRVPASGDKAQPGEGESPVSKAGPQPADDAAGLAARFRNWIDELPERQREAFELSRFEGMDHKEIAAIMEVSPKTVNNHIVAALGHLRKRYNHYKESKPS